MQAYPQFGQNKGTLVPGQAISVGKYNVQVERYLSQGGFAHVYLVRTAQPVYNTTHHVLKRIAVANEAMLTEVKKEVDIMRLLKGHPNIVHLIDAAWHALPNGVFEVFILMEFCPGGGIIDMMNRRLRERLTEAEILQIFVDVCEGVASMHNLRPALLHRDLKVENILQASPTSFKLCDFGSATTVARPPTNMQEIRALEADLNRHTTLQYRAPEMVDPYLRRAVDEKSDVWALGVLLYKLCYYTTPFEEHGPLAILNVQYRIPPYPVYSSHMNGLIASMLREHGTHRPTVFEVLTQVHHLRGTKSPFHYKIPAPQPLSPRHAPSQNRPQPSHAAEQTISYRAGQQISNNKVPAASSTKNNGVQARDKVLEAIAPMRRGRPGPSTSEQVPLKDSQVDNMAAEKPRNWLDEEEKAWKAATSQSKPLEQSERKTGDAWSVKNTSNLSQADRKDDGFGDDFAEKLWVEYDSKGKSGSSQASSSKPVLIPSGSTGTRVMQDKGRDAFEGLGLALTPTEKPPTLGEARKFRTGLATMSPANGLSPPESMRPTGSTPRLSPSPAPSFKPGRISPQPPSPVPLKAELSGHRWKSPPVTSPAGGEPSPESRFPSLEELDQTFGTGSTEKPKLAPKPSNLSSPNIHASISSQALNNRPSGASSEMLRPSINSYSSHDDGVRSQQVTGVAMKESRPHQSPPSTSQPTPAGLRSIDMVRGTMEPLASRPSLTRKHRSSLQIKQTSIPSVEEKPPPRLPPRPPKDWLTGDDDESSPPQAPPKPAEEGPKMRESPSKRASFIAQNDFKLPEALSVQPGIASPSPAPSVHDMQPPLSASSTTSLSRAARVFPELESESPTIQTHRWEPPPASSSKRTPDSDSSADEGPEDAHGRLPSLHKTQEGPSQPRRKGRQSSVHDLVDLWGGSTDSKFKKEPSKPLALDLDRDKDKSPIPAAPRSPTKDRSTAPSNASKAPSSAISSSSSESSRMRPQSMFVFPSKTPDTPKESSSLEPPEIPRPRQSTRRTSISDMVQKYEAIGGRTRATNATSPVPSSIPAVAALRAATETGRSIKSPVATSPSPTKSHVRNGSLPVPQEAKALSPSTETPGLPRTSPGLPRTSPVGLPRTSPDSRAQSIDEVRPRRISTRQPSRPDFARQDSVASVATVKSSDTARSSSPERPYQGVGKLIDQWQRKAADSDTGSPMKRAGVVGKRNGLIGGR